MFNAIENPKMPFVRFCRQTSWDSFYKEKCVFLIARLAQYDVDEVCVF